MCMLLMSLYVLPWGTKHMRYHLQTKSASPQCACPHPPMHAEFMISMISQASRIVKSTAHATLQGSEQLCAAASTLLLPNQVNTAVPQQHIARAGWKLILQLLPSVKTQHNQQSCTECGSLGSSRDQGEDSSNSSVRQCISMIFIRWLHWTSA